MKKKIFLVLALVVMLVCVFAISVSAKEAYLEPIPENLLWENDTVTHFIVFDDEKYYTGSGSTLNQLNVEKIEESLASLGISSADIGKTYLTKFVFPAYLNGTLLTYIDVNSSIKTNKYFKHVCGYVSFPGTMTKTHDMNDCVNQLRGIDFGENSQLTVIPYCFANKATKLKEVKNFPTAKLVTIEGDAFNGAKQAFRGELVINAKTIKQSAFNNATTFVTSLIFGENVERIETQAFSVKSSETGLGNPHLEYIEFKSDVSKIATTSYGPFYFELGGSSRSEYTSLKCIVLSNEENKNAISNGATIFNDIAPNSYIRFFLDETKEIIHSSHEIDYENATISYESFLENGTLTSYCTRCNKAETVSTDPLFVNLGFSAAEYAGGGMSIGFKVDKKAIEKYEEITGETVNYGVFAVLAEKIGANDIFDSEGKALAGVIAADITDTDFDIFNLKIVGFTGDQVDTKLAMGAYVGTTKDGTTEYAYLQGGTPETGAKYFFASYNDVKAIVDNKNGVSAQ
ncbi:MAG: leucine-rich repeat protein [Clostridia bacterium]|nr:leucine-rich repeat protein [Clostridia bacterium]